MSGNTYKYDVEGWMLQTASYHTSDEFGVRGDGADMGRKRKDKIRQHFYSIVAEVAYLHHNRQQGLDEDITYTPDWRDSSELTDLEPPATDYRLDFDAFGKSRLDVKMRMSWNYSNPDLIVRFEQDGSLHGQLFVQVDLDWDGEWMTIDVDGEEVDVRKPTKATIVGFATDEEAASAEFFTPNGVFHPVENDKGTEYPKTLVKREKLHDIDSIDSFSDYTAARRDGRDGDPLTIENRDDYQEFIKELESNKSEAEAMEANGETADA